MSIGSFFKSVEQKASAVVGFMVHAMTFAENLLGGKTGNAKLTLVMNIVNAALDTMGINAAGAEAELKAVIDALVALFNKTGLFEQSNPPAAPPAN